MRISFGGRWFNTASATWGWTPRAQTFGPYEPALAGMARICSALKRPIYGVLGNHDTIRMVPALEDMGIQMLLNENHTIERGDQRLYLAGIDDAHYYRVDNIEAIGFSSFSAFVGTIVESLILAAVGASTIDARLECEGSPSHQFDPHKPVYTNDRRHKYRFGSRRSVRMMACGLNDAAIPLELIRSHDASYS